MIHKAVIILKISKNIRGDGGVYYSQGEIVSMIINNDLRPFYNSREWRKLSKRVIKDGNYECYFCRKRGIVSTAVLTHHFNELKKRPDLAYSTTYVDEHGNTKLNLLPLCYECHEKTHKRGLYAEHKMPEHKFWQEEKW